MERFADTCGATENDEITVDVHFLGTVLVGASFFGGKRFGLA